MTVLVTGEDCRYPGVEGITLSRATRLMHWYMDRIMQLTTHDEEMHALFTQVIHMVMPPTSLFHPRVLCRMLGNRNKMAEQMPMQVGELMPHTMA